VDRFYGAASWTRGWARDTSTALLLLLLGRSWTRDMAGGLSEGFCFQFKTF
jgi:hypothetical protein